MIIYINQEVPQQESEVSLFYLIGTANILGWANSNVFFSDFISSISYL